MLNPTQSNLEARIETLESACEDLTSQRNEILSELKTVVEALHHSDASIKTPNLIPHAQEVINKSETQ